jgi:hypothetical protein
MMQVYDPTKHTLKQAIQHLEWALAHLEDHTDELDSIDPEYQAVDNCCYQIRDAYRELRDLV